MLPYVVCMLQYVVYLLQYELCMLQYVVYVLPYVVYLLQYERDVEDFLRRTSGQDRRDRDRSSHRREHHDRR